MKLWRKIEWSKPTVRKTAAVVIFAAALLVQYFLTNVPVPRDIGDDRKLRTVRASLAQEAVVLRDYAVKSAERDVLSYSGNDREIVSLDFDQATLGEATARLFTSLGTRPPAAPGPVAYFSGEGDVSPRGQTCRTFLEVKADANAPARDLVLYQLGSPGLRRFRRLELHAGGAPLFVKVYTALPEGQRDGPGCRKQLALGKWSKLVLGTPLEFEVAAGSALRVSFHPAAQGSTSWDGTTGLFDAALLDSLEAREVSVQPISADGKLARGRVPLQLRSYGDSRLRLKSLKLGSESIELSVAGRAWVSKDGRAVGIDLIERLSKNPTLGYLLGAANAALVALLGRWFFKSNPPAIPQTT